MCGCSKNVTRVQGERVKPLQSKEKCRDISWYENLLKQSNEVPASLDKDVLQSLLKSSVKIYDTTCGTYDKNIDLLVNKLKIGTKAKEEVVEVVESKK